MTGVAALFRSGRCSFVPGGARVAGSTTTPSMAGSRLFNRNVILLTQAQLVSQCGNQAFTIAVTFWTAQTTRSATATGMVLMAAVLPLVLLAPFTGTVADGRSRLRIIVGCDLVSGVLTIALGIVCLVQPDALRLPVLLPAVLAMGVCTAFLTPALNAFAPDLVEPDRIEAFNAFQQSSRQTTVLAAQGIGGVLYAFAGPGVLFLIDGLTFLFAAGSELAICPPVSAAAARETEARSTLFADTIEGFRYVRTQSGMVLFLVSIALFNALLMPMTVLLPVFATVYLKADVRWYGFLLAAISGGSLAGGLIIASRRWSGAARRVLVVGALGALAAALVVLGQVHSRWVALAIAAATGAFAATTNVLVVSITQRRTAPEFRGRITGLHATMTRALVPVGMVGGGAIADLTGRNVPLVYAVCGGLAFATVLVLAGRTTTRTFLAAD